MCFLFSIYFPLHMSHLCFLHTCFILMSQLVWKPFTFPWLCSLYPFDFFSWDVHLCLFPNLFRHFTQLHYHFLQIPSICWRHLASRFFLAISVFLITAIKSIYKQIIIFGLLIYISHEILSLLKNSREKFCSLYLISIIIFLWLVIYEFKSSNNNKKNK